MKKQIFSFLFLLLFGVGVSAQTTDKTVEKIRMGYTDISEKARLAETDEDRGQYGELVMNELVVNKLNHPWRAVGIHTITCNFFYTGGNSEEHMYPDELVLVKVDRKNSTITYNEEFLYDGKGHLVFYSQKSENDESVPADRKIYFSLDKPIRIIDDGESHDRLKPRDAEVIKFVTAESASLVGLFARTIKL